MTTKARKRPQSHAKPEPLLGIFWLIDGKLVIDSGALSEGEPYDNNLTHPRGHVHVWEQWQRIGNVPADVPYEEPPRGRVTFNVKTSNFLLLADRCILRRKDIVKQIKDALHLPKNTEIGTDPHYRCSKCLYGTGNEEDWDV